jgi:hypothetical protein
LLMGYFQGVVYPTNSMNRLTDADIPRFYKWFSETGNIQQNKTFFKSQNMHSLGHASNHNLANYEVADHADSDHYNFGIEQVNIWGHLRTRKFVFQTVRN